MSAVAGQPIATPVTVGADGVVSAVPCYLIGMTLTHTAATTAILYDNASAASGTKAGTIGCPANNTGVAFFGDEGIYCRNGLYADWTAGTLTVYIKSA